MELIKFANVLIVNKDDHVLVLRRTASHPTRPLMPDLPGGGLEPNESFETAAIREVKEETGLDLRLEDLVMIRDELRSSPERNLHGILYKVRLNMDNISITLSDEHDEYYWVKAEEIVGLSDFHEESVRYSLVNDLLN